MELEKMKKELVDVLEKAVDWADKFCLAFGLIEVVEEDSPPGIFVGDCVEYKNELYIVEDIQMSRCESYHGVKLRINPSHTVFVDVDKLILRASRSKDG